MHENSSYQRNCEKGCENLHENERFVTDALFSSFWKRYQKIRVEAETIVVASNQSYRSTLKTNETSFSEKLKSFP